MGIDLWLNFNRLFFGPFEKNSRTKKLKPHKNNSILKKKLKVSAKFEKITTRIDQN